MVYVHSLHSLTPEQSCDVVNHFQAWCLNQGGLIAVPETTEGYHTVRYTRTIFGSDICKGYYDYDETIFTTL